MATRKPEPLSRKELARLKKRERELRAELQQVERLLTGGPTDDESVISEELDTSGLTVDAQSRDAESSRSRRPVRDLVLDALADLSVPAHTNELRLYIKARYGREIAPPRFGTLSKDEMRLFNRGRPQAVYLCHGLTYDRFEPIKRLWCRSDWPIETRIVAPTSGRLQHLRLTKQLCEIAQSAADSSSDPMMMRIIAADHARDLPNTRVVRGSFALDKWAEAASSLLVELAEADAAARRLAAERLGTKSPFQQLFGVELYEVAGGTTDERSRSEG